MRATLLILLMLACAAGSADARRHRHHLRYYDAVTPTEPENRAYVPRESAPAPNGSPAQGRGKLVPADWREEPPDPQLNGQRFVSPDGNASFITYTVPA